MKNNHIVLLLLYLSLGTVSVYAAPRQYIDVGIRQESGDFNSGQEVTLQQFETSYGLIEQDFDLSVFVAYQKIRDNLGDQSGVGDIILRIGKKLFSDKLFDDSLYVSMALKLPTADENKGLGTGQVDIGGFVNYTQRLDKFNVLYSAGYIINGDSDAVNYNNIFSYGVGASRMMDNIYAYMNLQGRQQTLATGDQPLELVGGLFYRVKPNQFYRADILFGLSDSSPDYGVAFGVTQWF